MVDLIANLLIGAGFVAIFLSAVVIGENSEKPKIFDGIFLAVMLAALWAFGSLIKHLLEMLR